MLHRRAAPTGAPYNDAVILAADVGGTKTILGLFRADGGRLGISGALPAARRLRMSGSARPVSME